MIALGRHSDVPPPSRSVPAHDGDRVLNIATDEAEHAAGMAQTDTIDVYTPEIAMGMTHQVV